VSGGGYIVSATELGAPVTGAAAEPPAGQVPAASRGRRWVWPAGFIAAGLVLFVAYLREARTIPVMSDGASNALQAWDMLHGNLLLRGWTLTDVSFYTTELPEYMLVELARGLGADAAHIASALTYTLVVIGAALLAKGRADGREGAARAIIAAGIMLAPPVATPTAATLLSDPDHTGTQVPLLAIWLILDRARPRWWVPALVAVLLAGAQIADPLVTYEGVLPVLVVCAIRLYRRRGVWAGYLRAYWFELSLAAGAIVSAGVASLAVRLIRQAGGYRIWPASASFATVENLSGHVWVTAESVLVLFGADFSHEKLGAGAAIALVHLAGVALAAWGAARALRRFLACDLVVQVLAVTVIVLLVAYVVNGNPNIVNGPHEIAGVLPVGAVLAGRLLAGQLVRDRHLAALAVVLACYCAILAHNVVQPPSYDPNGQLASWLRAHHLHYGLASYWNASSVTVDTGGSVQVVPVNREAGNRIVAVRWESKASWYDPKLHDARFLVVPGPHAGCSNGTPSQWLAGVHAAFGTPAASYRVGVDVILVWHKNLLPLVAKPVGGSC
jgi:hypothetical protein